MNVMKIKSMRSLFVSFLLLFSVVSFSQTINEAGEAYNKGVEATKAGNFEQAIQFHLNCIQLCDQLGAEGEDLKLKATQQLAKQYLNSGINNYKAKDYNAAIASFKEASKYAELVNDTDTKAKAENYLAVFYSSFGMSSWKKEDYEKALNYFDMSLAIDPGNTKSILGQALVYKSQGDEAKMKEAIDRCINTGPANDKYVGQAIDVAFKYYFNLGVQNLQASDFNGAVNNITNAFEYGEPTGDAYYYLAVSYNSLSNWDKAVEAASNGIENESNDASNLYFELGRAFEGKGNGPSACDAFKNVISGPNAAAAKHKVEVELQCE